MAAEGKHRHPVGVSHRKTDPSWLELHGDKALGVICMTLAMTTIVLVLKIFGYLR